MPKTGISWALSLGAVTLLFASSCSDSPATPMGPSRQPPVVSDAQVLVDGIPVHGLVMQGTDHPAIFGVRVHAPSGLPSIQRVVLQYSQPGPNHHHGGPMMGGFTGTVFCYDDGTHGDDIAGDGFYHFMDPDDYIGCHGIDAMPGEYHYSFWCEDVYGQRSNTATVTIVRE
jgi:hypothetical protein